MYNGNPAFGTVRGYMIARSEQFPKSVLRDRTPACYVTFRSTFDDPDLLTLVRYFSVYVAVRNLRSQDDARHDVGNVPGMFSLIKVVNDELDGASLPDSQTSYLSGVSTMSADASTLVVRLTFVVYPFYSGAVTVDGNPLFDAGTAARVFVGSPAKRTVDFAFPGSNGVLRQVLGTAPRSVDVRGILRASDLAALQSKEDELEALASDSGLHTISDSGGAVLEDCAGVSYRRLGGPTQRWDNLPVNQRFVLSFEQLAY
jgi:hypothetical protein